MMQTERLPESMIESGKIMPVTVLGITKSGAIVQVDGTNYTGFIHISKVAKGYVERVDDFISKGDKLEAMGWTKSGKPELSLIHLNLKPKAKPDANVDKPKKPIDVPKEYAPKQHTPKSLDDMIADANRHFKDKTMTKDRQNRSRKNHRSKNS